MILTPLLYLLPFCLSLIFITFAIWALEKYQKAKLDGIDGGPTSMEFKAYCVREAAGQSIVIDMDDAVVSRTSIKMSVSDQLQCMGTPWYHEHILYECVR